MMYESQCLDLSRLYQIIDMYPLNFLLIWENMEGYCKGVLFIKMNLTQRYQIRSEQRLYVAVNVINTDVGLSCAS